MSPGRGRGRGRGGGGYHDGGMPPLGRGQGGYGMGQGADGGVRASKVARMAEFSGGTVMEDQVPPSACVCCVCAGQKGLMPPLAP